MSYAAILAIGIMSVVMAAAYFFESYEKFFRRTRGGPLKPDKGKTLGA